MNKSYLLTGGNLGDRVANLWRAKQLVAAYTGKVMAGSQLYETEAWGKADQPKFLNQAFELETALQPAALLERILHVEKMLGRVREEKYGPRIIDIDILLFNDEVIDLPSLKVPHPELPNRKFALMPLAEIAGDRIHPVSVKPIKALLDECSDPLQVLAFKQQD